MELCAALKSVFPDLSTSVNVRSRDAIAIVDNDRHRLDDFVILNSATAGHERYRGSNVMDTKLAVLDSIDTFLLRITKAPV